MVRQLNGEKGADLMVVSAFGRGHWLAQEASAKGLKVTLVDSSSLLGRWESEDWQGPFGIFSEAELKPSQRSQLSHEGPVIPVKEGLVVWPRSGPLDTRGWVAGVQTQNIEPLRQLQEHLQAWTGASESTKEKLRKRACDMSFSQSWLIHLAHQWAAKVHCPQHQGALCADPLPVFSEHGLRRSSRNGLKRSLKECEKRGVKVLADCQPWDIAIERGLWRGLEVRGEWSGALTAESIVWTLTSEETSRFSRGLAQILFPSGPLEPMWVWVRYSLRWELGEYSKILPNHLILFEDERLPWAHENFLSVVRGAQTSAVDVWVKIPAHVRFQRHFLEAMGESILALLRKKIPFSQPALVAHPKEHTYEHELLGPSLYPVFDSPALVRLKKLRLPNLFYCSADTAGARLDVWDRFCAQEACLGETLGYLVALGKNRKEEPNDISLQSP